MILLSSVIGIYSDNLAGGGKLLEFACLLGVVSIVFGAVKPVLQTAEHFLEQYTAFMTSSSASLSLLLASGGQAGAAAVHASSSAFTVGLMQILSSGVVLPCAKLVLGAGRAVLAFQNARPFGCDKLYPEFLYMGTRRVVCGIRRRSCGGDTHFGRAPTAPPSAAFGLRRRGLFRSPETC